MEEATKSLLDDHYDLVIIGSGAGGATLAYGLKDSSFKILILERGPSLFGEKQPLSEKEIQEKQYLYPDNTINTADGSVIDNFSSIYCAGGKTKVYGSALLRMREEDFSALKHLDGVSPAWPITYYDIEPFYSQAEEIYSVHGDQEAFSEPFHSKPYPFPPKPYDTYIQKLYDKLVSGNYHPTPIPLGFIEEKKAFIRWKTFDGFPSPIGAKSDSEVCCLNQALNSKNISMITGAEAHKLITDPLGLKVIEVEVLIDGKKYNIKSRYFAVSCGALHSPLLFLKSKNAAHPNGLANSSGLVGKNLMMHNVSALLALHPLRKNTCTMQKTFQMFDCYFGDKNWPYPMGAIQTLGHMPLESHMSWGLKWLGRYISDHSIQMMALSEDLPVKENSVSLASDGNFRICYKHNNLLSHQQLVLHAKNIFKKSGYPIVTATFLTKKILPLGHACGTLCFGRDPKTSVLNDYCQTHDIANLFAVDACFFPSSSAVNPSLTIMAQALRVAEYLKRIDQ